MNAPANPRPDSRPGEPTDTAPCIYLSSTSASAAGAAAGRPTDTSAANRLGVSPRR
ncbi:hypothetical protein GXW82_02030 [Streptacidiphilus sp. 4-A2]|nr:hypothetical protein [Streptacidiphilus sp. 4-A2]